MFVGASMLGGMRIFMVRIYPLAIFHSTADPKFCQEFFAFIFISVQRADIISVFSATS